jgi:hypothetical protein
LANDEITKQHTFGGKQIVLVGEFLQLKPVPSLFDNGNFMFTSPLFASFIPHRFELTQNMHQSDPKLLFCISEIRMGKCSKETEQFIIIFTKRFVNRIRKRCNPYILSKSQQSTI